MTRLARRRIRPDLGLPIALGAVVAGVALILAPLVNAWADPDGRAVAYPLAAVTVYTVTALVVGSRRRRT